MTHICVNKLAINGSDNGLSPAWPVPSHHLNHWWNIVNWTLGKKLQWKWNSYIFIHENAVQKFVGKMVAICLGLNVLIWSSFTDWIGTYTYIRSTWANNGIADILNCIYSFSLQKDSSTLAYSDIRMQAMRKFCLVCHPYHTDDNILHSLIWQLWQIKEICT